MFLLISSLKEVTAQWLLLTFGFAVSTEVLERGWAQSPEGSEFKFWSLLSGLGTDAYLLHLSLLLC